MSNWEDVTDQIQEYKEDLRRLDDYESVGTTMKQILDSYEESKEDY